MLAYHHLSHNPQNIFSLNIEKNKNNRTSGPTSSSKKFNKSLFIFLVCIVLFSAPFLPHAWGRCSFDLVSKSVVASGDLISAGWLWEGEGSVLVTTDPTTHRFVVYPQSRENANFNLTANFASVDRKSTSSNELFMVFDVTGKPLFATETYATVAPLMLDGNMYVAEEHWMRKYNIGGKMVWEKEFCSGYRRGDKDVSDMFNVYNPNDKEGRVMLGFLQSLNGACTINTRSGPQPLNFTHVGSGIEYHTPYLAEIDKDKGTVNQIYKLESTRMDMVRSAVVETDGSLTLVGMITSTRESTTLVVARYEKMEEGMTTSKKWEMNITTPHPHNFLWAQASTTDEVGDVLFVADPESTIQLNPAKGDQVNDKVSGLVFGAVSKSDGTIKWRQTIPYGGIITSTFVGHLGDNYVLVAAVWDGVEELKLGKGVTLPPMERPAQSMLGFFAVWDVGASKFRFVQEVAPELAYPGHHVAVLPNTDGTFNLITSPVFWDNAPNRRLDGNPENSLKLDSTPQDIIAVVVYRFDPRRCKSGTSVRRAATHWLEAVEGAGLVIAFVLALVVGIVFVMQKRGWLAGDIMSMLGLRGGRTRVYTPVAAHDEEEEEDFQLDMEDEGDPFQIAEDPARRL